MQLSLIEQSARLQSLYTQLCFCYNNPARETRQSIINTLLDGLERLTVQIPWLAGQVVYDDPVQEARNKFKIVEMDKIPNLVVKDYCESDAMPTMAAIAHAEFPFSMLSESKICPRNTLPPGSAELTPNHFPVFMLQVTFIKGGVLISVLASHATMDISGQVRVIRLLSKACRREALSDDDVWGATLDRSNIIPLLDVSKQEASIEQPQAHGKSGPESIGDGSADPTDVPRMEWAYFKFQAAALADLKAELMAHLLDHSSFISTDDALCALIWACIGKARASRLPYSTPTTFVRQVEVRHLLAVPQSYLGNVVTQTKIDLTLEELSSRSLGSIAATLRGALNNSDLVHNIRAHATAQARNHTSAPQPQRDRSQTIVMSSWSKTECYDIDFGLELGSPIAVRRPRFSPVEGVVYLLPKAPDGTITAGLCLRDCDMRSLIQDEKFTSYGAYIG